MTAELHTINPFTCAEIYRHGASRNVMVTPLPETYAQAGEDLIIESILGALQYQHSDNPFAYIEIGANHPIEISNTYLLYKKHGLRGVLVEADPGRIEELKRIRPDDRVLHTAVSARQERIVTLHLANASELLKQVERSRNPGPTGAGKFSMTQ